MAGQQSNKVTAFFVAQLLTEIGFIIAVPLVGFIFFGHWLDVRFGFRAIFVFVGLILSLILSSWIIFRKIKSIETPNP